VAGRSVYFIEGSSGTDRPETGLCETLDDRWASTLRAACYLCFSGNFSVRQMTSDDVITELGRLHLPRGEYVVVGGAALAVRGIRDTDDIDLVVTPELFEHLAGSGWAQQMRPNGKPGIHKSSVEAYFDVDGEDFKRSLSWLLSHAEVLRGHAFVDLETLAGFKSSYARAKDLHDLDLTSM
jgi:hypothetical protein